MTNYYTNASSRKPNESGPTLGGCLSLDPAQRHGPPCESNEISMNLQDRVQETIQGSIMETLLPRSAHQPDSTAISGFNAAHNRYVENRRKRCQEISWPFCPPALELLSIWSPTEERFWSAAAETLRILRIWAGGLAHSTTSRIVHNSERSNRTRNEACDEAESGGRYFAEMLVALDGKEWRNGIPKDVNLGTLASFVFEPGDEWVGGSYEKGLRIRWISIRSEEANVQLLETSPKIRDMLSESFEKGRRSAMMTGQKSTEL